MGLNVQKITGSLKDRVSVHKDKAINAIGNALERVPHKDAFQKVLNKIEPTGANNAFIPLAGLMFFMVVIPRVLTAAKRNPDDKEATKDEIKEILFRDLQTIMIMLFLLKAAHSMIAAGVSKKTGLPLTQKPYRKLFNSNEKGLAGIKEKCSEFIHNPIEKLKIMGKNVLDTIHPTAGVKALTNEDAISKYSGYNDIGQIKKLFDEISNQEGDPDKVFNKIMDILIKNQQEVINNASKKSMAGLVQDTTEADNILKALEQLKSSGLKGLDEKLNSNVESQIINFFTDKNNRLVKDVAGLNGAIRTGALALESTYLGFGLPALNEKRLEKKYLHNKENFLPDEKQESSTTKSLVNKSIKAQEVKLFNNFIK